MSRYDRHRSRSPWEPEEYESSRSPSPSPVYAQRYEFGSRDKDIDHARFGVSAPAVKNNRHHRTRSLSLTRADAADSDRDLEPPYVYHARRPRIKYYEHERLSVSSHSVKDRGRDGNPARYDGGFLLDSDPLRDLRFGIQALDVSQLGLGGSNRQLEQRNPSRTRTRTRNPRCKTRSSRSMTPSLRRRQYRQVHVLILTWAYHDLKPNITTPAGAECISLEEETERLRDSFEGFGYRVHEYLIPMQRSSESLRARLRQFCRYASDDTLLIVYYHGHGSLNDDKELVFSSHEHPMDPRWSQAAAAELYAALITGEACSTHSRSGLFQQLTQKYARFRPIAEVKWDDIRGTILGAPCDLLLILDCCAAGGANLRRVDSQPLPPQAQAEGYTKHLFAACGFESSTVDDMTATMCDVLDQYVPDPSGAPLTTKRLHQIMEERLQDSTTASQPIFKQLLPMDPERYITLPNLRDRAKRYL